MILAAGDPCGLSPTISSVGTPATQAAGNCSTTDLTIRTTVSLSATLTGTGCKLQKRTYFGTSATPSYSGWSDEATTGSSINHDYTAPLFTTDSGAGWGPSATTYYYNVQYQIVGTDGSTVCDGPDTATQWTDTVYTCFE